MTATTTASPTTPPEPTPTVEVVIPPTEIPPYLRALADDAERAFVAHIVAQLDIAPDTVTVAYFAPIALEDLPCEGPTEDATEETYHRTVLVVHDADVYDYIGRLEGAFTLCQQISVSDARGELLTLIDSIAADSVAAARRQLATTRDLPSSRVRLVDVVSVTWPDTSLGCPVEGQTYTELAIDGYRVELLVGEERHIFHADFQTMQPCEPENEVLPPDFEPLADEREAIPETTPEATPEATAEATEAL